MANTVISPSKDVLMRLRLKWNSTFFQEALIGYLFLIPLLVVLLGVLALPVGRAFLMTLQEKHPGSPGEFVGLKNYQMLLFEDQQFPRVVKNSLIYTVGTVAVRFSLGMIMALVLNQKIRFREFFRGWLLLSWITPIVVGVMTWNWMLQSNGVFNYMLRGVNLIEAPVPWLSDPTMAMISLIMAGGWAGFPFFGISFLAGMQAISEELYEAAKVDGASALQQFWHVTVPGLRPIIIVVTVLSTIWVFNTFARVWLLTRGGPGNSTDVLVTYAYKAGLGGFQLGYGAAITLVFAPVLLLAVIYLTPYLIEEQEI